MPAEFYAEYARANNQNLRRLLWVMNPNKFRACERLVKWHEARGDKTIVFSDNIFALLSYARQLGRPFIYGDTSNRERLVSDRHAVCGAFRDCNLPAVDLQSLSTRRGAQDDFHLASRRQLDRLAGRQRADSDLLALRVASPGVSF